MAKNKKDDKKNRQDAEKVKKTARKLDKLTDKFDKLADARKSTQKTQKKLLNQNTSLRKEQADLEKSFAKLSGKTSRLKQLSKKIYQENGRILQSIALHSDDANVSRGRIHSCEVQIAANTKKLAKVSERLKKVASLHSEMENLDAQLNQRLSTLEATIGIAKGSKIGVAQILTNSIPVADSKVKTNGNGNGNVLAFKDNAGDSAPTGDASPTAVLPLLNRLQNQLNKLSEFSAQQQSENQAVGNSLTELSTTQLQQEKKTDHMDLVIDQLRTENADNGKLRDALDTRLEETATEMDALVPQVSAMRSEFQTLAETAEAQLSSASQGLQAAIDALDGRLTSQTGDISSRFTEIEQRLSDQHSELALIHGEVKKGQLQVNGLQDQFDNQVSEQSESLLKLDERTSRQQSRHQHLMGSMWAIGIVLLAIAGGLYWQTQTNLQQQAGMTNAKLEELQQNVLQQQSGLSQLEGKTTGLEGKVSGLTGKLSGIEGEVSGLEGEVSGLADTKPIAAPAPTQETLKQLQTDADQQQVLIEQQSSRLSEQQLKISELSEQLAEQRELINQQAQSRSAQQTASVTATTNIYATPVDLQGPEWLAGLPGKHYTIQVVAGYHQQAVKLVAANPQLSLDKALYQRDRDGKPWYILLYGDFSTFQAANEALENLPAEIKIPGPWVRKLSQVQSELSL